MSLRVIEPPAHPPVSIGEAKAHLRYFQSEEDASIAGYIRAATAALDGPEGSLGRCLIAQTLELTADCLPARWTGIRLPCPPLIEVLSVAYVDHDGTEQVVDPDAYQVCGVGDQGAIMLAYGATSWPPARHQPETVRVTYRAGYGETWNDIPEHLREAVLLLTGTFFNQRETTVEAGIFETGAAQRLFMPSKVYLP